MKKERKVVDQLKVLVRTLVTDKKILDRIHSNTLQTTNNPLFWGSVFSY